MSPAWVKVAFGAVGSILGAIGVNESPVVFRLVTIEPNSWLATDWAKLEFTTRVKP